MRINPPWMRFWTASPRAVVAVYLLRLLSITFGENVIVVDASILAVALAEALGAVLVTADARLSGASRRRRGRRD